MMFSNHAISYQNVVSKYYTFSPENLDAAVHDLRNLVTGYGYHPTGALFYSMISEPTEDMMLAEIFMPVEENKVDFCQEDDVSFRSYFHIKPMIMTRIVEEFEVEAQVKYWDLIRYLRQHHLEQKTPVFVELKVNNEGKNYIELGTGVKTDRSILDVLNGLEARVGDK